MKIRVFLSNNEIITLFDEREVEEICFCVRPKNDKIEILVFEDVGFLCEGELVENVHLARILSQNDYINLVISESVCLNGVEIVTKVASFSTFKPNLSLLKNETKNATKVSKVSTSSHEYFNKNSQKTKTIDELPPELAGLNLKEWKGKSNGLKRMLESSE